MTSKYTTKERRYIGRAVRKFASLRLSKAEIKAIVSTMPRPIVMDAQFKER